MIGVSSLSKAYGVTIVVSDSTRAAVPELAYRCLDLVRVKGKLEPVRIYEPVGPANLLSAAERETLDLWDAVLSAYASQQWDIAERQLTQLRARDDRKLYALYAERIAEFRLSPPAAGWDGVYTYTTK